MKSTLASLILDNWHFIICKMRKSEKEEGERERQTDRCLKGRLGTWIDVKYFHLKGINRCVKQYWLETTTTSVRGLGYKLQQWQKSMTPILGEEEENKDHHAIKQLPNCNNEILKFYSPLHFPTSILEI